MRPPAMVQPLDCQRGLRHLRSSLQAASGTASGSKAAAGAGEGTTWLCVHTGGLKEWWTISPQTSGCQACGGDTYGGAP